MKFKSPGKKILLFVVIGLVFFSVFSVADFSLAQDDFGVNDASGIGLGGGDLKVVISNIIRIILGFLGFLGVLMVLYGGFIWMTAGGDPVKVEKAKKILVAAIIGLIIILSAFTIVSFVISAIQDALGPGDDPGGGCPGCPGGTSNQYSYISGFREDTIGWSQSIGWTFHGVMSIPASVDLEAKGYARNRGGEIEAMELNIAPDGDDFVYESDFLNIPADQEIVEDIYAGWDTGSYNANDRYKAKILVSAPGISGFESSELDTIIRPLHCFNGVQDGALGETGVDCGGDCGGCPGDSCDSISSSPVCDPDDDLCRYGICDPVSCICPINPEITYISPADDVEGDTDFDDPDTWDDDVPNGAPGNYITIWGVGFGDQPGEVWFDNVPANLDLYDGCDDTWKSTQIIAEVPDVSFGNHDVTVITTDGLVSNIKVFVANDIERPGICGINPYFGAYPATTTPMGINFPLSSPQEVVWSFGSTDLVSTFETDWTENSVVDTVPDNRSGGAGVRVYGGEYSNYIRFLASRGGLGDPCGLDVDQNTGVCSAQEVCQSGLVCDYTSDCTCQLPVSACDYDGELDDGEACDDDVFRNDNDQCSDYGFGDGNLSCNNCQVDTSECSGGPSMRDSATQSIFTWLFSTKDLAVVFPEFCGNNVLDTDENESCDLVDGSYQFSRPNGDDCQSYNLGDGTVSCSQSCQLIFNCTGGGITGASSQSIYYWAFAYSPDLIFGPPYVIEDCDRDPYCQRQDLFPSPTPWFEGEDADEGWIDPLYPQLEITNAKACINSWVLARFSQSMDEASINSDNVVVLSCDDREGTNCQEVDGDIRVEDGGNGQDQQNDYMTFAPSVDLTPNGWYKVVMRDGGDDPDSGVRSLYNVRLRNDVGVNGRAADRYCNVGGITDVAYCWNFQVREANDPDLECPVGCITCAPDRSYARWFLANKKYVDIPDSEDNVCLMLNAASYDWEWREKECPDGDCADYSLWEVPAHDPLGDPAIFAKSWLIDPLAPYSSIPNVSYAQGTYMATTTAFRETFILNGDYLNFYDSEHVRIEGLEVDSRHYGYCRTHNDFTNPIVMEDVSCRNGTTQSPTPWINSENACLNALVSARFSRPMVDSTVIDTDNIIIHECGDQRNDAINLNHDCGNNLIQIDDQIQVFDYSHTINYEFLVDENLDNLFGPLPEGFIVYQDDNFEPETWYRVIILGGLGGVRGSTIVTEDDGTKVEVEDPQGVLLTPSIIPGVDYNGDGEDDYFWIFKTADQICEVDTVEVAPADKFMRLVNDTQQYTAFAQAANCNILNPCRLDWNWQSIRDIDPETGGGADASAIAVINNINSQAGVCVGPNGFIGPDITDPVQTARSYAEGEVDIKALEPGGAWDWGNLQIGYGLLRVDDYYPRGTTMCTNEPIQAVFNIDVETDTVDLNENFKLYQCDDGIAYYSFDDNAEDSSGNQNNGTPINGVRFIDDVQRGGVADFDGIDDCLEAPTTGMDASQGTVAMWVKRNSSDNVGGLWTVYNGDHERIKLSLSESSLRVFYTNSGLVYNNDLVSASFDPPIDSDWHYVVFTYDFNVGNYWLYVDGERLQPYFQHGNSLNIINLPSEMQIGCLKDFDSTDPFYYENYFDGRIDDVKIYSRALNESEIQELYLNNNSECSIMIYPPIDSNGSPIYLEDYGSLDPFYVYNNRIIATTTSGLLPYARYRVVVKGGSEEGGGIVSWNGKELSNLNYNEVGGSGEECEPNIYPWNTLSGVCNTSDCTLSGDLCSTRFAECDDQELVARYPFDSGSADVINNIDGIVFGDVSLDGFSVFGSSYRFNGQVDDYIQLPDDPRINTNTVYQRTINFWFRANQTQSRQVLYEEGGAIGLNVYLYENKLYAGFFGSGDNGQIDSVWLETAFSDTNAWHQVTIVLDSNASQQTMYIDGSRVDMANNSGFIGGHSEDTGLGAMTQDTHFHDLGEVDNSGNDYHFMGWIDELSIYNSVLSADLISDLNKYIFVSDYCDDDCHNLGNTNLASCANNIIESGEECDDGNTNNDDGCSYNCLWEGSNNRWGSLCGNGRIEYGENCDDGNTDSGDGCSDICLIEGSLSSGAFPNLPVCGNSQIERGEDCDDGNTDSNDGCSNSCLHEGSGSGATCGNNLVEASQLDGFSWVFGVDNLAETCDLDVYLELNPCPNGIWRFTFNHNNIIDATVKIQQGYDDDQSSLTCELANPNQTFWQKAINKIKIVFKKIFGIPVTAAIYWCDISVRSYDLNDLLNLHPDNYVLDEEDVADDFNMFEIIGHKNRYEDYVLNYINHANFIPNVEYRAVVEFSRFDGQQDSEEENITMLSDICQIDELEVNIWPIGEEKYIDNFFCNGNDCGQNSSDKYLKDQDYYEDNNQHLYRSWAINDTIQPGTNFILKPVGNFDWEINPDGLGLAMNTRDIDESDYTGDQWVELQSVDPQILGHGGEAILIVDDLGSTDLEEEVNINIFLCDSPWPSTDVFPYIDALDNCSINLSSCPNTNFKIYYCRDWGTDSLIDDLPALDSNVVVSGSSATTTEIIKEFIFQRQDIGSSDAIGIRVSENNNHYSPLLWYQEKFPFDRQTSGQLQAFSVDSYQAIEEGRTTYVSAADLNDVSDTIYNDIYLISYTDSADDYTKEIYRQMSNYMRFNVGDSGNGGLYEFSDWGFCSNKLSCDDDYQCQSLGLGNCVDNLCTDDVDCLTDYGCDISNLGYCSSEKSKLTRDTIRLGDVQDINLLLSQYHFFKRCDNDHEILCGSDLDCYGGGDCDNYYPTLPAGTYVTANSFSVWPSWQSTLGNALGSGLPTDPINEFVDCVDPHNPTTCWDESSKTVGCPDRSNSRVYTYNSHFDSGQQDGDVYAPGEYNPTGNLWSPDWNTVSMIGDYREPNIFSGYLSWGLNIFCPDDAGLTCGWDADGPDLSCDTGEDCCDTGEDCHTCWSDCACDPGTTCQESAPSADDWDCRPVDPGDPDWDLDGVLNGVDVCPWDPNRQTDAGQCGCGGAWSGNPQNDSVPGAETDTDSDGTPDCVDDCPDNSTKIEEGDCGCSVDSPEIDTDSDGTPDCNDLCPDDPQKLAPGDCGCGIVDYDIDGDGEVCNDLCPYDPDKTDPLACGCGELEEDYDGDTVMNCQDNCPTVPNINQLDSDLDCPRDADGLIDSDSCGGGDLCDTEYIYNSEPVELTVIQGGWSRTFTPYVSAQTPADFYNNITEYSITKAGRSNIFAYINSDTNIMSLGFVHDTLGGSDGDAQFNIYGDGWNIGTIVVSDDSGNFAKNGTSYPSDGLFEGDWDWLAPEIDGGIIEVADLDTEWTILIEPDSINGIVDWMVKSPGGLEENYHEIPDTTDPIETVVIRYGDINCGNGVLEGGETCDCGTNPGDPYDINSPCFVDNYVGSNFIDSTRIYNITGALPSVIANAYRPAGVDPLINYCDATCNTDSVLAYSYCGDGHYDTTNDEECDSTDPDCENCLFKCRDLDTGENTYDDPNPYVYYRKVGTGDAEITGSGNNVTDFNITPPPPNSTSANFTVPECRLARLAGYLEADGHVESTAVVFVSDLSNNMAGNLQSLKDVMRTSISSLFANVNNVQIGLVAYQNGAVDVVDFARTVRTDLNFHGCGPGFPSFCDATYESELNNKVVEAYYTAQAAYTSSGVQIAHNLLSGITADNKIIILMSAGIAASGHDDCMYSYPDPGYLRPSVCHLTNRTCQNGDPWWMLCCGIGGSYADRWDWTCDATTDTTTAKNAGIEIYSVAFTDDHNLQNIMNNYSSNASGPCNHDYCFGGSNINSIYASVINNINASLTSGVSLTIDSKTTSYPFVIPNPDGSPHTYWHGDIGYIPLSTDFCTSGSVNHTLSANILGGNASTDTGLLIANLRLEYCPAVDIGLPLARADSDTNPDALASTNDNGQVAGATEKNIGLLSFIKNIFKKIINSFRF